jgi:hypothetical protein
VIFLARLAGILPMLKAIAITAVIASASGFAGGYYVKAKFFTAAAAVEARQARKDDAQNAGEAQKRSDQLEQSIKQKEQSIASLQRQLRDARRVVQPPVKCDPLAPELADPVLDDDIVRLLDAARTGAPADPAGGRDGAPGTPSGTEKR